MSHRIEQVNSVINKTLGTILPTYLPGDKQGLVTITDVKTSPDMSATTVWISVFGKDHEQVLKSLNKQLYAIQGDLNKHVNFKKNPRITFKLDESGDQVARITHLIEEEKKDSGNKE